MLWVSITPFVASISVLGEAQHGAAYSEDAGPCRTLELPGARLHANGVSPVTRQPLHNKHLTPNTQVKIALNRVKQSERSH